MLFDGHRLNEQRPVLPGSDRVSLRLSAFSFFPNKRALKFALVRRSERAIAKHFRLPPFPALHNERSS